MPEMPSIALVTPNYNQAHLIRGALESVLDQRYPNLEYVVIDGASSDASAEVIREYSDRLHFWISEPDSGHYNAVNKGFEKTTGEIMGYLNSDDTLLPGALGTVAEIFTRFPEIEWITGSHTAIDSQGRPVAVTLPEVWSRWHTISRKIHRFIPQESTFWRRSLWERAGGGLDESYPLAADYELWTRFATHAQLHTVFAPLGCFRFVEGQRSVAQRDGYMDDVERVRRKALERPGVSRALRTADLGLAVTDVIGLRRLRRTVNRALGAPAEIVFVPEAMEFQRVGDRSSGAFGRRMFRALGGRAAGGGS